MMSQGFVIKKVTRKEESYFSMGIRNLGKENVQHVIFLSLKSFGSLTRGRRKRIDPEAAGASKQTEVVEYNLQESTKSNCTVKVTHRCMGAPVRLSTFDRRT
ncbi:uncharacterized protein LOC143424750 [Xylocopa sonorina]|uniref:uncharacterized protein LOC143424750 n=1 Tax=Xylocopa sonorina TaxID=1818115 RepID=UPI00403AAC3B